MKKRNRILSLLLAGVMALGLTACGASNAGAAADETGSAQRVHPQTQQLRERRLSTSV